MIRLDVYLLQKKLASSRTHAQELIHSGQVFLQTSSEKKCLNKPSLHVAPDEARIVVIEGPANRFVSRGGLKLAGALAHLGIQTEGFQVLDVGISTGGFTDCLLQSGVRSVLGIDVGHGQLHRSLAGHPQVTLIEGINAREMDQLPEVLQHTPAGGFDLVVMDVSFISITLIIPKLTALIKPGGHLLSLVKPQFEVGAEGVGRGGLVKDPGLYSAVGDRVKIICESSGLNLKDYFHSTIEGKDGNREFFVYAQKADC
jgi:23S rRNA (cytidine1920-2'-O)/16S rRNA (cytidine1409-2'-O)-methyltransferase